MPSVTCSPGAPVALPTTIVALPEVGVGSSVGPAVTVGVANSGGAGGGVGVGTGVGGGISTGVAVGGGAGLSPPPPPVKIGRRVGVGVWTRVGTAEDVGSDASVGGGVEVVGEELVLDVGVSNPAAAGRAVGGAMVATFKVGLSVGTNATATAGIVGFLVAGIAIGVTGEPE